MLSNKYILGFILGLLLSHNTFAAQGDSAPSLAVSVDARVRYEADQYAGDDNIYDDIKASTLNITLTAQLSEKIRAKIRTNLAQLFAAGTAQEKLGRAIEEATIEIHDINGTPIAAVIFGKEQVFGDLSNKDIAAYKDSLLYDLFTKDQVIGLTIQLKEVLGFAISASAFENSAGDLQFGDGWGFSASASRQLTENLRLRASAMAMDKQGGDTSMSDRRATIGLVYTSADSKYSASVDGLYFDGQNAYLSDKHFAVKAEVKAQVGPGTVRVEAEYLERVAYEVAAAYDIPVADGLVISPSIHYRTDANGNGEETKAMIEARVRLSNQPQKVK